MTSLDEPTRLAKIATLGSRDLAQIKKVLARDPIVNCFVTSRVEARIETGWNLPGQLLGYFLQDELESLLFAGANVVPVETTPHSRELFAHRLKSLGRRCTSIVGAKEEVLDLWARLESAWAPPRDIRTDQPVFAISQSPLVQPSPQVRLVEPVELDALLPACVAMFTEEVGVSPLRAGEAESYRQRIAELIRQARAYAIFDAGEVVFKAEVGAIGGGVCQVQGVWVKPELRGRGMAAPALAAVIEEARHTFAPVVSLYANSFNELALRVYRRLGMHQVATFATVLW